MKTRLKTTLLAAVMLVAAAFCAPAHAETKVYNVGTEPTFPPFEMLDSTTGEITGFDIELLKAIAADQGFEIKVHSLGFDGLIPAVLTGKIDLSASGFTITEKRAKVINFSDPYIDAGIGVMKLTADDRIKSIADLKGKTVAVQIGTSGQKTAEDLQAQGKVAKVVVMDNSALAVTDLLKGRVDAVVNDIPVNVAYVKQSKGELEMLPTPLNTEQYGFVLDKKDTELLKQINQGLKNLRANGTYDKIYDKYFNVE